MIGKTGKRLARFLLEEQTPSLSLDYLSEEGHSVVCGDGDIFYVYSLVFPSGERYRVCDEGGVRLYETPALPRAIMQKPMQATMRGRLRAWILPEDVQDMGVLIERDKGSIASKLENALAESQIREKRAGAFPYIGTVEEELATLLYVPALSAEGADWKVQQYGDNVTQILMPYRLCCNLRIVPLHHPKYGPKSIFFKPTSAGFAQDSFDAE